MIVLKEGNINIIELIQSDLIKEINLEDIDTNLEIIKKIKETFIVERNNNKIE